MGSTLRSCSLVDASVSRTAPLREAVETLASADVSAIAVLEPDGRVAGLFTEDDAVRVLFPGYVEDLRHTAFLELDADALAEEFARRGSTPVEAEMRRRPDVLAVDTSALHVAERFLHCEWGALPVVDESQRFLGMVRQADFVRVVLGRLSGS